MGDMGPSHCMMKMEEEEGHVKTIPQPYEMEMPPGEKGLMKKPVMPPFRQTQFGDVAQTEKQLPWH